jgi:hypothetical protein
MISSLIVDSPSAAAAMPPAGSRNGVNSGPMPPYSPILERLVVHLSLDGRAVGSRLQYARKPGG